MVGNLNVETGFVDVPGGQVWYRAVGDCSGFPALVLHGGPGSTHDYLVGLDALAAERGVIYYDQLGSGKSGRDSDPSLWTLDYFVAELGAIVEALKIHRPHVIGHSWGGMLALEYAARHHPDWSSITAISTPLDVRAASRAATELMQARPFGEFAIIERHEAAGTVGTEEYLSAVARFGREHICRLDSYPPEMLASLPPAMNLAMGHFMVGYADWNVTGTLRDWEILGRLPSITQPTLMLDGEHSMYGRHHMRQAIELMADARFASIEDASHFPMCEVPGQTVEAVRAFLASVDQGR